MKRNIIQSKDGKLGKWKMIVQNKMYACLVYTVPGCIKFLIPPQQQIGKLFKRGGKKGRKTGKKEEKEEQRRGNMEKRKTKRH